MTTPIVNTDPVQSQSRLQHEPNTDEEMAAVFALLISNKALDLAPMVLGLGEAWARTRAAPIRRVKFPLRARPLRRRSPSSS